MAGGHHLGLTGEQESVFVQAMALWAKDGLVDRVMVESPVSRELALSEDMDFAHYINAASDSDVEFWVDAYWGTWPHRGGPRRELGVVRSWRAQGMNGGVFYYMRARPIDYEQVNWQMRLVEFPAEVVDPHPAPRTGFGHRMISTPEGCGVDGIDYFAYRQFMAYRSSSSLPASISLSLMCSLWVPIVLALRLSWFAISLVP